MIYLRLRGRIGNQLFMYAFARKIQLDRGNREEIYIEDVYNNCHDNTNIHYENSLVNYPLENVKYLHDRKVYDSIRMFPKRCILHFMISNGKNKSLRDFHTYQVKWQKFFNFFGVYCIQDGYEELDIRGRDVLLYGYFQSERYFKGIESELRNLFRLDKIVQDINYPGFQDIIDRNSVCISIKVQHNAGDKMYGVCTREYYEKAIDYINHHVDNPLYFVCSDDVEYVKKHLIDTSKYDVISQSREFPVHLSLSVMAHCKHFIIGNSSFAWWAQYLSEYEGKIVVAPRRWYGIDVPCDIYQDNWIRIDN